MYLLPLKYFQEVARQGYISKAAETLHISAQTLSASIIALEKELGYELFDRTKGKANVLNAYGTVFLEYADKILALNEEAIQALDSISNRQNKVVSLASTGLTFPNRMIVGFRKKYPEYQVQQHIIPRNSLPDFVERSDIELVFSVLEDKFEDVEIKDLWEERVYLIVFASHPFAHRERISLKEAEKERFVLMPGQYYWSETVKEMCRKAGFEPKVEVECFPDQYSGLLKKGFVTVLSEGSLESSFVDGVSFCAIPLTEAFCKRTIRLLRKKGRTLSEAAQKFWDYVVSRAESDMKREKEETAEQGF